MMEGPRAAKSEELVDVIHLVNELFMSRPGRRPIMEKTFPQLFSRRNLENLRVIVKDGKPVSHVGVWEGDLLMYGSCFKVGMVGAVCTHPDYRGRGYASVLVEDAFSKMRRDGVDLVLVSGFRNLYRRAGCVEAGMVHVYHIPAGELDVDEDGVRVATYKEGHVDDLAEIYESEPVRYRRSLEDFRLLAERGFRCKDIPLKIHMAVARARPVAYMATGLLPNGDALTIWEYAGLRRAILYLIENVLKVTRVDSAGLTVPFHDLEMLGLLEGQGLERPPSQAPASVAILNPLSFLEKAKPFLEERIGRKLSKLAVDPGCGEMKLTVDGERLDLEDPRALTLLFFGSPEKLVNPPQPALDHEPIRLLANVVPLPTPVYALNFI